MNDIISAPWNTLRNPVLDNIDTEPEILMFFSEMVDKKIFENPGLRSTDRTIFDCIGLSVEWSVNDHIFDCYNYGN